MSSNIYATRTEVILANLDEDGLSETISKTTRIHIGKDTGDGWAFLLHIYPDMDIRGEESMLKTLEDGWEIECALYGKISLNELKVRMIRDHGPIQRQSNRVGHSHNCDYLDRSFS